MMSYKQIERRLVDLERAAAAKQRAWIESLSDEDFDRYVADIAERDPVGYAAFEAMSDEDLDRACDGRMSEAEWDRILQQAKERINAAT